MAEKNNTQESEKSLETKKKVITLSIADAIAVGMFLISLGTSIGFYMKTVSDIGELKNEMGNTKSGVDKLNVSVPVIQNSVDFIKNQVEKLEAKTEKK